MKSEQQIYPKQIAQTVAAILGLKFKANHPVGEQITLPAYYVTEKSKSYPANNAENALLISIQK